MRTINPIPVRWLLAVLYLAIGFCTAYGQSLLVFPRSNNANIGIIVMDLSTGETVAEYNAERMLTPASITKCVTAAAVEMAGLADDTYLTEVFVRGSDDGCGRLYGDIVVKASGDPTIESGRFAGKGNIINAITKALHESNINEIYGALEIDSVGFKEQGPIGTWEIGDLRHAYGAGLYALNFRDNAANQLALEDPGEELLIALEERLDHDSIDVDWNDVAPTPAPMRSIATIISPTLAEILRVTLETSHNLYAEAMLRKLAPWGYRADALKRETTLLAGNGIDVESARIFDGSGLTRANSMTPRFMASLLAYCARQSWGPRYIGYFPLVGREGTVRRLLSDSPLAGQLALKSGSMNGVQTYAGYKLDMNGQPTHVVVVMVNDFTTTRARVVKSIETFLEKQFPQQL